MVSVIVACYNYGWVLSETLDSLLRQTYADWECIVVDDGSSDNTRAVGEEYQRKDSRFRYLHQQNQGMSAARNQGIAVARGTYLQFLDADDLLAPRKLELQAAYLDSHPATDLVYGDVCYFRHDNPAEQSCSLDMLDQPWMSKVDGQGETLLNAIVEKNLMVSNAPLFRAALIERVGLMDVGLRSAEDWEFWVRCAMSGARFYYQGLPETRALVRVHATSTSQNVRRMYDYEMLIREQLRVKLSQLGADRAVALNELAMEHGQANVARHYLLKDSIMTGIKEYVALARTTGKYRYYLGSAAYWLRARLKRLPA